MLQQSTYGRPYDYMYGGGSGSLANVDFIVESGDRVTGHDGAWLDNVDFIPPSDSGGGFGADGLDFIPPDATMENMDFIPPDEGMDDMQSEQPVIEAGLDVKASVGDIKIGRPRLPRRNRTGKWYESKPGQTAEKKLPDGCLLYTSPSPRDS